MFSVSLTIILFFFVLMWCVELTTLAPVAGCMGRPAESQQYEDTVSEATGLLSISRLSIFYALPLSLDLCTCASVHMHITNPGTLPPQFLQTMEQLKGDTI